jgi:hypothetical protein
MRRFIVIFLLYSLILGAVASGQTGQTSFDFLLIGLGSRAAAMGEAYTAVGGEIGAAYFNPASAGHLKDTEFSLMHVNYLTDVSMDHFMVISHAQRFHYGLGLYYGKVSDIQRRGDTPTDEPLGTFDEHNFAASFIWALPVSERFYLGNSIKWAYEKLDLSSASALGLDFGVYYMLNPNLDFGTALRNLGTKPKFDSTSFDQPLELRFGLAYHLLPRNRTSGLLLAADYILPKWGNDKTKVALGFEYSYNNLVALRMGYDFGYDSRNFSIGGGITYTNYYFDYAFVPSKNNLNDTHRFTLRIKI